MLFIKLNLFRLLSNNVKSNTAENEGVLQDELRLKQRKLPKPYQKPLQP